MMRSMFSGVSGLRVHQTKMDVIGNNIANVNTVGFKSGRVNFQEIFSQTLRGAGAPDGTRGGTNPMQVGLGLGVGSVDIITTRGSLQRTDNPTDLSIEGEGFFIAKSGGATMFTRAGNFGLDKQGNLVTGSGLNVYGWDPDLDPATGQLIFNTEKEIEPINLYTGAIGNKRVIAPKATTAVTLSGNLNTAMQIITAPTGNTAVDSDKKFKVPMTVYDELGNSHEVNVEFFKTAADDTGSTWAWRIMGETNKYAIANDGTTPDNTSTPPTTAAGTIKFGVDGKPLSGTSQLITIAPDATSGTGEFKVAFDFSSITSYSSDSSVKPTKIDGYQTGNLVTFNIGSDGIITGIYDNGQQQALGMVALAVFDNPAGLQKVGDNMYIQTTNSGDFQKAQKPGANGAGALSPGTLEMSNVDLSKEFTDMITTQRGFQANSRIITTSDEMLQELVSLKR